MGGACVVPSFPQGLYSLEGALGKGPLETVLGLDGAPTCSPPSCSAAPPFPGASVATRIWSFQWRPRPALQQSPEGRKEQKGMGRCERRGAGRE